MEQNFEKIFSRHYLKFLYYSQIAGGIAGIIGSIVAIAATAGVAAVAIIVTIVIGVLVGFGTGGFSMLLDYFNNKKYAVHIEKLIAALKNDQKCYQQFDEELGEVRTDSFRFKVHLDIGLREYQGEGLRDLKRLTRRVIKPIEIFSSSSNAIIKKTFAECFENENVSQKKETERKRMEGIIDMLKKCLIALKDGAVFLVKSGTTDDLIKALGPITVVFSSAATIYDIKKLIEEIKEKSLGQHFEDFSKEICQFPLEDKNFEENNFEEEGSNEEASAKEDDFKEDDSKEDVSKREDSTEEDFKGEDSKEKASKEENSKKEEDSVEDD